MEGDSGRMPLRRGRAKAMSDSGKKMRVIKALQEEEEEDPTDNGIIPSVLRYKHYTSLLISNSPSTNIFPLLIHSLWKNTTEGVCFRGTIKDEIAFRILKMRKGGSLATIL